MRQDSNGCRGAALSYKRPADPYSRDVGAVFSARLSQHRQDRGLKATIDMNGDCHARISWSPLSRHHTAGERHVPERFVPFCRGGPISSTAPAVHR